MKKPRIIAEIGCNHMGDIELAKKMIALAKLYIGADAVKFQKRHVETWANKYPELYNAPHPNPKATYGRTYKEHRDFLEFDLEINRELKKYCETVGIVYSTSVWDVISAQEIASIKPLFIKIPSACNTNFEMIEWLCDNYEGEIQISTGMTTKKEIDDIFTIFSAKNRTSDLVIYHCIAGYPVPYTDMCLLDINMLINNYGNKVKEIGFSGHHIGTAIDIAAYTLGATTIERHYTLDKTWKGTDHAASLEPDEFKRLVLDIQATYVALTNRNKEILDIEEVQRKKLKW